MGKGNAQYTPSQARKLLGHLDSVLGHNRALWLVGVLAFFIPSVAASAWYANTNSNDAPERSTTLRAGAYTVGASATSFVNNGNASSTANATGNASSNESSRSSKPEVSAQVTINGEKVEIPPSGNVSQSTVNTDGSSSHVNVSVNADQSNSSSSGFSSTHVNSFSSTNSHSTNNSTSTTFFNNSHTASQ